MDDDEPPMPSAYQHRAYLGWITDLASKGEPTAEWPSLRLDDRLMRDYQDALNTIHTLGFNEIVLWGFYVSRNWPVNLAESVPTARGQKVECLIEMAHAQGLKVLSGLGVYSWGFEEIIRANPKLARDNPQAMCASAPAAWDWMRRVIDFVFARFAIDGVSMQSADQGRCHCSDCKKYTDPEYHALLNVRAAEYIRQRWPGKIVGVSSWGMDFSDPAALPSLKRIATNVDYLVDFNDSSRNRDKANRRKLIAALPCAFGTLGGPQTEPPQHWPRDRWFLPTLRRTSEHLRDLAADGGRAVEYFFHIQANPGDEMALYQAGGMLRDPAADWRKLARQNLDTLYRVSHPAALDALLTLFLDAEEAYYRYLPETLCGTVSLEPLVSNYSGPPVYLTERLAAVQRADYAKTLTRLLADAEKLRPEIRHKKRGDTLLRCLQNAAKDAAS